MRAKTPQSINIPANAETSPLCNPPTWQLEIGGVSAGNDLAAVRAMTPNRFVYILKALHTRPPYYVGLTSASTCSATILEEGLERAGSPCIDGCRPQLSDELVRPSAPSAGRAHRHRPNASPSITRLRAVASSRQADVP